ncbi:MAG: capsular biosynthesis protein [Methylococcales bacterium]|nr:capsular biosynthesis protein [Methylococcales bacterium]
MSQSRRFLLLQGVCSPFFLRLADQLIVNGHRVFKVNFNAGDLLYWGGRPASNFRGASGGDYFDALHRFFGQHYRSHGITDQVLFGDCRPVHRPALEQAKACGIRTHVFEEGYFRPYWVTLEREGVNGHSLLPRDSDWFRAVGAGLPDYGDGVAFPSPFIIRAAHDVVYHTAGLWNPLLFPHYHTHAPVNAAFEYFGYIRRLPLLHFLKPRDQALVETLHSTATPFYLLPLQLGSDAQIREHSPFTDMAGVMAYVMASFAKFAPPESKLLIKNHPLDMGLVNYPKVIRGLEARFDLVGRVIYIETGDLGSLLKHALGMVTVNSTAGTLSLAYNCPTITLSNPVYNLPGLTFQGELDDFWQQGHKPDDFLFRCFRNTVIHTTQVNGGFYCRKGIALAVKNSVSRLESERSPLEDLLWA